MTGSKEIWEQQRQYAEIDNMQVEEMAAQYSTRFCSGCQTNWETLPEVDEVGDETYCFCPLCRTDEHLQEGREGHSYRFDPITGSVVNALTGLSVVGENPAPPPVKPLASSFDEVRYYAAKAERERQENRMIDEYLKNR